MKRERLTLIPIEYLFIVFGSTQKGTSQKSRNNNIDAFCKRRAIIMIFLPMAQNHRGEFLQVTQ